MKIILRNLKRKALASFGSLILLGASLGTTPVADHNMSQENINSWKTFHATSGKCKISLPSVPEHISQRMRMPEEGYDLQYDVYVASHEKQAVYMVLIAQYPPFVNEDYAEMSLESFLNGILSQNENNRLLFADLVEVNGNKALDFFIQTNGVYFKGRAIMAKNNLYLLAMECEVKNYQEVHFNHFVNSFQIDN